MTSKIIAMLTISMGALVLKMEDSPDFRVQVKYPHSVFFFGYVPLLESVYKSIFSS